MPERKGRSGSYRKVPTYPCLTTRDLEKMFAMLQSNLQSSFNSNARQELPFSAPTKTLIPKHNGSAALPLISGQRSPRHPTQHPESTSLLLRRGLGSTIPHRDDISTEPRPRPSAPMDGDAHRNEGAHPDGLCQEPEEQDLGVQQ